MRVTVKGQVTIPKNIRDRLGISPGSEVDFIEKDDHVELKKKTDETSARKRFGRLRGSATVRMTTDEIMKLTRAG